MKKLMIHIHPSNYPHHEDAQSLYEDIQTFYDACCQRLSDPKSSAYNGGRSEQNAKSKNRRKLRFRRSSNSSPTTVIETVVQFNVRQKWPWLDGYLRPLCPEEMNSGKTLSPLVAYQCINARGKKDTNRQSAKCTFSLIVAHHLLFRIRSDSTWEET